MRRRLTIALLFSLLAGCLDITPAGTHFSSSPPGAHVIVDGRDSGFVTPTQLALDRSENHKVRFQLDGFRPVLVVLRDSFEFHMIPWTLGVASGQGWHFPLFLELHDLVGPIRINREFEPARIHVRMKPVYQGDEGEISLDGGNP